MVHQYTLIGCHVLGRRVIIRDPYEMIRGYNERGNGGNCIR